MNFADESVTDPFSVGSEEIRSSLCSTILVNHVVSSVVIISTVNAEGRDMRGIP